MGYCLYVLRARLHTAAIRQSYGRMRCSYDLHTAIYDLTPCQHEVYTNVIRTILMSYGLNECHTTTIRLYKRAIRHPHGVFVWSRDRRCFLPLFQDLLPLWYKLTRCLHVSMILLPLMDYQVTQLKLTYMSREGLIQFVFSRMTTVWRPYESRMQSCLTVWSSCSLIQGSARKNSIRPNTNLIRTRLHKTFIRPSYGGHTTEHDLNEAVTWHIWVIIKKCQNFIVKK